MVVVISMVMIAGTALTMMMVFMLVFGEQGMHHIHENRFNLLILPAINHHDAHLGADFLQERKRTFAKAVDGLGLSFFFKDFQQMADKGSMLFFIVLHHEDVENLMGLGVVDQLVNGKNRTPSLLSQHWFGKHAGGGIENLSRFGAHALVGALLLLIGEERLGI